MGSFFSTNKDTENIIKMEVDKLLLNTIDIVNNANSYTVVKKNNDIFHIHIYNS